MEGNTLDSPADLSLSSKFIGFWLIRQEKFNLKIGCYRIEYGLLRHLSADF
jgi:hypothetical protein